MYIYVFYITQLFSSVSINILQHLALGDFHITYTHTHTFKDN